MVSNTTVALTISVASFRYRDFQQHSLSLELCAIDYGKISVCVAFFGSNLTGWLGYLRLLLSPEVDTLVLLFTCM